MLQDILYLFFFYRESFQIFMAGTVVFLVRSTKKEINMLTDIKDTPETRFVKHKHVR